VSGVNLSATRKWGQKKNLPETSYWKRGKGGPVWDLEDKGTRREEGVFRVRVSRRL